MKSEFKRNNNPEKVRRKEEHLDDSLQKSGNKITAVIVPVHQTFLFFYVNLQISVCKPHSVLISPDVSDVSTSAWLNVRAFYRRCCWVTLTFYFVRSTDFIELVGSQFGQTQSFIERCPWRFAAGLPGQRSSTHLPPPLLHEAVLKNIMS